MLPEYPESSFTSRSTTSPSRLNSPHYSFLPNEFEQAMTVNGKLGNLWMHLSMHHQRDLLLKNIVNNLSCKSYKMQAAKHYAFVTFGLLFHSGGRPFLLLLMNTG